MVASDESMANLVYHFRGDESDLVRSYNASCGILKSYENMSSSLQQRVSGQWQSMERSMFGNDGGFSASLRRQMEQRQSLQQQLYEATTSPKDVALSNNHAIFQEMRSQYKGHQEMLTLIDRVESAKRASILKQYENEFSTGLRRMLHTALGKGTAAAFLSFFVSNALQGLTQGIKTYRESGRWQDVVSGFAEGLPVIGHVTRALKELTAELTGLNATTENAARYSKINEGIRQLQVDLGNKGQLIGLGGYDAERKRLEQEHISNLEKIQLIKEQNNDADKKALNSFERLEKVSKSLSRIQWTIPKEYVWVIQGLQTLLKYNSDNLNNLKSTSISSDKNIQSLKRTEDENYRRSLRELGMQKSWEKYQTYDMEIEDQPSATGRLQIRNRIKDMQLEAEFIGKTNEERENYIQLVQFEQDVIKNYGVHTEKYYKYMSEFENLQKTIRDNSKFTTEKESFADKSKDYSNEIQYQKSLMNHYIQLAPMAKNYFEEINNQRKESIELAGIEDGKVIRGLQNEIDKLQLAGSKYSQLTLALMGLRDQMIEISKIKAFNKQTEELKGFIKELREGSKNELQKFQDEIGKIIEARNRKIIDDTEKQRWEELTARRYALSMAEKLSSFSGGTTRNIDTSLVSVEALSAGGIDKYEVFKQQLSEAQKQTQQLETLNKNLNNNVIK